MRTRNKAYDLMGRGLLADGAQAYLIHNLPSYVPVDPDDPEFQGTIRRTEAGRVLVEWHRDRKTYSLSQLALKVINQYKPGGKRPSAAGPRHWGTRRESYADWADRVSNRTVRQVAIGGGEYQTAQEVLLNLSTEHVHALRWFDQRAGTTHQLPRSPLLDIYLVSQQKGIHKPKGWETALSIRQTAKGQESYPDKEPIFYGDGSWVYEYHEEVQNGRTELWTNKSLHYAMQNRVPIGVMRQRASSQEYDILGVGIVVGYQDGYFRIMGMPPGWLEAAFQPVDQRDETSDQDRFDPSDEVDRRQQAIVMATIRRGQAKFRHELDLAYREKCAVTSTSVRSALQAAHIIPYRGPHTHRVENGLLLRADWHALFDSGLFYIDPEGFEVVCSVELDETEYHIYESTNISLPDKEEDLPSALALKLHRDFAERNATY